MRGPRDRNFKFVFAGYRGFSSWVSDEIVDVLRDAGERIAAGALAMLCPRGMSFETSIITETNTLQGPGWPRERTVRLESRPAEMGAVSFFARVGVVYEYFNPRDGDGWTLEIAIHETGKKTEPIMQFSANSHTIEEKLALSIDPGWIGSIRNIDDILRRVFDDESTLREESTR